MPKYQVMVRCDFIVEIEAGDHEDAMEQAVMKAAHECTPGVDDWYAYAWQHIKEGE